MVTSAINTETGKKVERISNAKPGQLHKCLWCGANMWPVLGAVVDQHFRLAAGQQHTHPICRQLERSNIAYKVDEIDRGVFFSGLFRPQNPKKTSPPPGGPNDPTNGGEGYPGVEPGDPGHTEGGPTEPPEEGEEGPSPTEVKSPEQKVVPCHTLAQAYRAGIADLPPYMRIGNGILADIFLFKKHFWKYLTDEISLSKRVIELYPLTPFFQHNAILFSGSWVKKTVNDTWDKKHMLFLLKIPDRDAFNKVCKKLFELSVSANGKSECIRKTTTVLVAGEWERLSSTKYSKYGIRVDNGCLGVYIADYHSSKQLYLVPKNEK